MAISSAMVLAAGLGVRMRPLTDDRPKPLVPLAGRTLLDRALDRLDAAGVGRIVVNTHYLAEMIHGHLAGRGDIVISHEADLLETGGGVRFALPQLGANPFFVVNSDAVLCDGPDPALSRLVGTWDDRAMDALLMLQPIARATGYHGSGDYHRDGTGALRRRVDGESAPYVFTGVQILHPRLFRGSPDGAFSLVRLFDRAQQSGRLFGLAHDGEWYHVGTPADLASAEAMLSSGAGDPP
jgi:MurNAc alpha-1-phosphate uridylyltransferase